MTHNSLRLRTDLMTALRGLQNTEVFSYYADALKALDQSAPDFCRAYARLCEYRYRKGDLGRIFAKEIYYDTNVLTSLVGKKIPEYIRTAADYDLYTVNSLIALSGEDLTNMALEVFPRAKDVFASLPGFPCGTPLSYAGCDGLMKLYEQKGYGFFARANAYTMQSGTPEPIAHPDPIRLSDLKGYVLEKKKIIDNTLAFLNGQDTNNVLLYGDKGCGKSSTVKAIANEYADRGLKIIQMPVEKISCFPDLCGLVAKSPFHFILFFDDMAFTSEDSNFINLKAFIEGGLTGKPDNLVIYATSNRRHIIRESFADRQGDDIHVRDTLESSSSLSDRFGLEITFSNPGKGDYLSIVEQLAEDYGLTLPTEQLHLLAERFAIRKNGRSPRTARQFIMHQMAVEAGDAEQLS